MQLYSTDNTEESYDASGRAAARRRLVAHTKEIRRKRIIRNVLIVILMVLAFCSGFFGRGLLNVHAEEENLPVAEGYYGSIRIRRGDNLWDIAKTYSVNSSYSTREYVEELMRINNLDSEEIHAGEYLTVVYYK